MNEVLRSPLATADDAGERRDRPIRVLVVDDSAVMRELLSEILAQDPRLEVVGTAAEPFAAWDKIGKLEPDVLTLDVEMPRMDGLTFLEKLMRLHPMPVVMVSSATEKSCATTLRALELGAIDFVTKPKLDLRDGTLLLGDEIVEKVATAAGAGRRLQARRPVGPADSLAMVRAAPPARALAHSSTVDRTTRQLLAIGASTGGPEALRQLLMVLPTDSPAVVIVQHMPEGFTRSFAERLDTLCGVRVKEARDGDRIAAGHVLIAPGDFHLEVVRRGAHPTVRVHDGEAVNRHRPSVDVLFHSCASEYGRDAVGALLTGMGADGARGLLAMRRAGAATIAQDEATSVVFGMPREAIALGAAAEVVPLERIATRLLSLAAPSAR